MSSSSGLFPNTKTQRPYRNPITPADDFVGPDRFNKPAPIPTPMGKPQPANVVRVNQGYKKDNPLGYWTYQK